MNHVTKPLPLDPTVAAERLVFGARAEAGRWMIRATNNGVTVLIDPQGRITERVPAFEEQVLYGEVTPMQGLTPYLRWRSWPLIAVCLVLLGWGVIRRRSA